MILIAMWVVTCCLWKLIYIITLRLMLCSDWSILAKNSGSQSQHITRIFAMYFFLLCNCDISTKCWEAFFNALLFCCLRWLATEYLHSIMNTTKQFTKMDTIVRKTFSIWIKHFFRSHVSPWLHRDNAEVLPLGKSTFLTIVLHTYPPECVLRAYHALLTQNQTKNAKHSNCSGRLTPLDFDPLGQGVKNVVRKTRARKTHSGNAAHVGKLPIFIGYCFVPSIIFKLYLFVLTLTLDREYYWFVRVWRDSITWSREYYVRVCESM